jgi:hypothetical protein
MKNKALRKDKDPGRVFVPEGPPIVARQFIAGLLSEIPPGQRETVSVPSGPYLRALPL